MTDRIAPDEYATVEEAERQRDALLELFSADPLSEMRTGEVMREILASAPVGAAFSQNSLRAKIPAHINPARLGPAFGRLIKDGYIRHIGTEASTKKNTHGKPVNRYVLVVPSMRGERAA